MFSPASEAVPQGHQMFDFIGHEFQRFLDWLTKVSFIEGPESSHAPVSYHEIKSIVLENRLTLGSFQY